MRRHRVHGGRASDVAESRQALRVENKKTTDRSDGPGKLSKKKGAGSRAFDPMDHDHMSDLRSELRRGDRVPVPLRFTRGIPPLAQQLLVR